MIEVLIILVRLSVSLDYLKMLALRKLHLHSKSWRSVWLIVESLSVRVTMSSSEVFSFSLLSNKKPMAVIVAATCSGIFPLLEMLKRMFARDLAV